MEMPYKEFAYVTKIGILSNISHAPITHGIEKITMTPYYGVEIQITTNTKILIVTPCFPHSVNITLLARNYGKLEV